MILHPKVYNLYFETTDVPKKIWRMYHWKGAKIIAFRRRLEYNGGVTLTERRSTTRAVNLALKKKILNFSMIWDAVQFEKNCDHYEDGIPDDITECKCYQFLCELLSNNDFVVRKKGTNKTEYKLNVIQ